ncbi:hypothetical protein BKA70DRAFT_1449389 [Coprinopsis sp. MPI-PUGE-AT-0042]|nr:hypothetical protein BKA70DRAFT_1449389 [Coprinopsis sp. MPI-PUGE-AT-0042]
MASTSISSSSFSMYCKGLNIYRPVVGFGYAANVHQPTQYLADLFQWENYTPAVLFALIFWTGDSLIQRNYWIVAFPLALLFASAATHATTLWAARNTKLDTPGAPPPPNLFPIPQLSPVSFQLTLRRLPPPIDSSIPKVDGLEDVPTEVEIEAKVYALVGAWMETFLYGVYLYLFAFAMKVLARKKALGQFLSKVTIAGIIAIRTFMPNNTATHALWSALSFSQISSIPPALWITLKMLFTLYATQNILTTVLVTVEIWLSHREMKRARVMPLNTPNLVLIIRIVRDPDLVRLTRIPTSGEAVVHLPSASVNG